MIIRLALSVLSFLSLLPVASAADSFKELDSKRVDEVAAMLPQEPAGFGRPCTDRKFWDSPKQQSRFKKALKRAEGILPEKMPEWSNDVYLEYSRNGVRANGDRMVKNRVKNLAPLVLAECLENRNRFTAKINELLKETMGDPTWTMPSHDYDLGSYNGKSYFVDLQASAFSFQLAQALYLLGDKIAPATREKVIQELNRRIFKPVRKSLETGDGHWWLGSKSRPVINNWNAVCLAGVTGAALSVLPERRDRAVFVAASEHYSRYYLNGLWDDGYCDEGVGYWNYGFGSFIELREILARATSGRIDLFSVPKVRNAALYSMRIRITDNAAPAFSDCHIGSLPSSALIAYCDHVLNLGLETKEIPLSSDNITTSFFDPTPLANVGKTPGKAVERPFALRSYFDKAGVLVCRPAAKSSCRLGVAIKAGGNGGGHSHNDIGSFVVSLGDEMPVGEPGGPYQYDKTTFSSKRYTLKLINSFGHPVPVVAGKLQLDATEVHPAVLSTSFSDKGDEISMDIACAYKVPELKKLVRTMKYDRGGSGSVSVTDEVEFSKPAAFELGLPANGTWKRTGPKSLEFSTGQAKIVATIETAEDLDVTSETIDEQGHPPFDRVGIKLRRPVQSSKVTVIFRPSK